MDPPECDGDIGATLCYAMAAGPGTSGGEGALKVAGHMKGVSHRNGWDCLNTRLGLSDSSGELAFVEGWSPRSQEFRKVRPLSRDPSNSVGDAGLSHDELEDFVAGVGWAVDAPDWVGFAVCGGRAYTSPRTSRIVDGNGNYRIECVVDKSAPAP